MIIFLCIWIALQIIGEMLPISSSTHLMLFESFLHSYFQIDLAVYVAPVSLKTFYYFIHGPTLIIMLFYFIRKWLHDRHFFRHWFSFFITIGIADTISIGGYFLIHGFGITIPLSLGLFITILLLFSLHKVPHSTSQETLTVKQSVFIGCAQVIAFLPGVSRLAITYTAARWLGLAAKPAFEIAWLIQLPLIFGAWLVSVMHVIQSDAWIILINPYIVITILCSTIIAWYVLTGVVYLMQQCRVDRIAWYLLIPWILSLIM